MTTLLLDQIHHRFALMKLDTMDVLLEPTLERAIYLVEQEWNNRISTRMRTRTKSAGFN